MTVDLLPWAELAMPYSLGVSLMTARIGTATMRMPGLSSGRVPNRVRMSMAVVIAMTMSVASCGGHPLPW